MRRLLRCAAVLAAVLAAGLGFGLAFAAPAGAAAPQPIAPSELSKATNAAHSSNAAGLLAKFPVRRRPQPALAPTATRSTR
jgi:hypothetical protein